MNRSRQNDELEAEDCSSAKQHPQRSKSRTGSARRSARHRRTSYDYFNAMQLLGEDQEDVSVVSVV